MDKNECENVCDRGVKAVWKVDKGTQGGAHGEGRVTKISAPVPRI